MGAVIIKIGEIYQHQKGAFCKILHFAKAQHDETPLVVYQDEYANIWVCPEIEFIKSFKSLDGRVLLTERILNESNC